VLGAKHIEEMAAWCWASPDLTDAREEARKTFYGGEDPRSISYQNGTDTDTSKKRRFLGWFMFGYTLPDGRVPAEAAAEALYGGRALEEARTSIRGSRYVLAVVASHIPGRAVFLELEEERFEVRNKEVSRFLDRGSALATWLIPSRRGLWLLGPGWLEWPYKIGPNMRWELSKLQMDPLDVDRSLRTPTEGEGLSRESQYPGDRTLEDAVARMTEVAQEEGRDRLVMSPEEWTRLVLDHLPNNDAAGFSKGVVERVGEVPAIEDLNRWLSLAMNIWNNTPQPDRDGMTAFEMSQGADEDRLSGR